MLNEKIQFLNLINNFSQYYIVFVISSYNKGVQLAFTFIKPWPTPLKQLNDLLSQYDLE